LDDRNDRKFSFRETNNLLGNKTKYV
jgi:hypothetical protein